MANVIDYRPSATIRSFIRHFRPAELFADWIIGPVGSGKTTGIFFKLVYLSTLQAKSPIDGKRHVRAVVVRNTMPQLNDTTIPSWFLWFKDKEAGEWRVTDKKFTLRFADVECEVLFRALDTPDDVSRVLSLETTFVILDEFVQIPKQVVEALAARCGRYPSAKDGGATNWGMWGSSNPGNEDDWWYDALANADAPPDLITEQEAIQKRNERILAGLPPESTWTYWQQPSGFSDEVENAENLPGGRNYYSSLAKDKSEAWIKQYIEVEWGWSIAGKPVITTFNRQIHVAKGPLRFQPALKLVGGLDPGLAGMSMIFGQVNLFGQLCVTSEIITRDYGAERFITDKLRPHLQNTYRDADFLISPDPAAKQRAQTDEKTVASVFAKKYKVKVATDNNRLPGRIQAIEHFTTRITENGPALQIDPRCVKLIRALGTGWRYATNTKGDTAEAPIKNEWSHPGDAFSYLCQYFFHDSERTARRYGQEALPTFTNSYHAR